MTRTHTRLENLNIFIQGILKDLQCFLTSEKLCAVHKSEHENTLKNLVLYFRVRKIIIETHFTGTS